MNQVPIQAIIDAVPAEPDELFIKSARREHLHFFWEPDHCGLWSSPSSHYLPLPVHNPSMDGDHGTLWHYSHAPHKIRWLQALHPFLAFWPLDPEWTGIFSGLELVQDNEPITRWSDGPWHLSGIVVTALRVLETNLLQLGLGILRRNIDPKSELAKIYISSLPTQAEYDLGHTTPKDAITAAYNARNAFTMLSAFVSFGIAMDIALHPVPEDAIPAWFVYAEKTLEMDAIWLNELKDSFVCNFTRGFRPGAYLDATLATCTEMFAAFTVANVPLFICWGFSSMPQSFREDDPILRYRPCRAETQWAVDQYNDSSTSPRREELEGPQDEELSEGDSESTNHRDYEDDESDWGREEEDTSDISQGSAQSLGIDYSVVFPPDIVNTVDAITALRVRYQYLIPQPYNRHPLMEAVISPLRPINRGDLGPAPGFADEINALKRLGMQTASSDDNKEGLMDFYNYLSAATTVFAPLWDLAPARRSAICDHPYFRFIRWDQDLYIIAIQSEPLEQQPYLLVVYDARVVVELFSMAMNSMGELAQYLIRNGIAFATGKPVISLPPSVRTSLIGYTYVPSSHQFTLGDYRNYLNTKATILSGPAGRAAISTGGIVWRLSLPHVVSSRVSNGPLANVTWEGKQVAVIHTPHRFLVDDALTIVEEDIICGAYKVFTGLGGQTEEKSWFPKASSWEGSSWDHGYWTPDNEKWYQDRLLEIRNGQGPKNAKEWRNEMRKTRPAAVLRFRMNVSDVYDRFLQGDTSYWMA